MSQSKKITRGSRVTLCASVTNERQDYWIPKLKIIQRDMIRKLGMQLDIFVKNTFFFIKQQFHKYL